jgi:hypothetical protein
MHGPIKVKSPNNASKWQMGFNSAFKGLSTKVNIYFWPHTGSWKGPVQVKGPEVQASLAAW